MQSVVDIVPYLVQPLPGDQYNSLTMNYNPNHCRVVFLTQECWKVFAGNTHDDLKGGPLEHRHRLYEIHGHWGRLPEFCREHTVDQHAYAGELHLLHTNIGRCLHPSSAGKYPDPKFRAVIGIFLQVGQRNEELTKITDMLREIPPYNRKNHSMPEVDVDPASLFPERLEYWTYYETRGGIDDWVPIGPEWDDIEDDTEKVTYIIFQTPIEVSEEQFQLLYPRAREAAAGGGGAAAAVLPTFRSDISEGVAARQLRD